MTQFIVQYGISLALLALPPLAALMMKLYNAQALKAGLQNQLLAKVEHFASVAVAAVDSSPMKDAILAASADGVISAADGAALKSAAINLVKQLLGSEGLDDVKSLLGIADPATLIGASVEKAVDVSSNAAVIAQSAAATPVKAAVGGVTTP